MSFSDSYTTSLMVGKLSTMESEYIALSQAMKGALPFVSLMKDIMFEIKLQGDTPTALYSLFENTVTVYKDNQGAITLVVYL